MLKGLNNNNNNNNHSFSMESLLADGDSKMTGEEEANDVLVRCLKNRVCSSCGRVDCNLLQCCNRVGGSDGMIKDSKPVLKFSVSAILGNEQPTSRNIQNGK